VGWWDRYSPPSEGSNTCWIPTYVKFLLMSIALPAGVGNHAALLSDGQDHVMRLTIGSVVCGELGGCDH